MNRGRFKVGHRAKPIDVPFIERLRELGYNSRNLPQILGVSKAHWLLIFQEPNRMTGTQYIILSHLLCIPLATVINTLFKTPPQSPHYLTEDYSTNYHVQKIKEELGPKLSKNRS